MNHQSFQIWPIWPTRLHLGNSISMPLAGAAHAGCAYAGCSGVSLASFIRAMFLWAMFLWAMLGMAMSHGDER